MAATGAVALALSLAACGGDDEPAPTAGAATAAEPKSTCHVDGDTEHELRRSDGGTTFAVSVGSGERAVILMPMLGADHCSWMLFARQLAAKAGVQAWAVDSVGSAGLSVPQGDPVSLEDDVVVAAAAARAAGATSVAVAGASMGGTTALGAASAVKPVKVATLSSPADFERVDGLAGARGLTVPLLAVVGEQDSEEYVDAAHAFVKAVGEPTAQYVGIQAPQHGTDLLEESVDGEKLTAVLEQFLTS